MSIYETIISRRTIRKFDQKKIDPEILKKIVNAGRLAPSAANLQPLEYLIVDDEDLRKKYFPILRGQDISSRKVIQERARSLWHISLFCL